MMPMVERSPHPLGHLRTLFGIERFVRSRDGLARRPPTFAQRIEHPGLHGVETLRVNGRGRQDVGDLAS